MHRRLRHTVVTAIVITPLLGLPGQPGHGAERPRTQLAARSFELVEVSTPRPEPLKLPGSALEPIDWNALDGWAVDDHAAALATFLASCRPLLRTPLPKGETRPMYFALTHVCRQALAAGRLAKEQARMFFENNFRPLRITKLGDRAGVLTGYYEPIVDGSRFPTGIFKVPIYRRPRDLVPPLKATGPGFPNRGQSLRRTSSGQLVPYYDRGEILDGALDGRHLEICWIKDPMDALLIQIEGSARVRLEDGTMLRINYDGHNGYPFVPLSRIFIERRIIPREEMSLERIREWMRANPESAEEVRRQNRSFVFFRIAGLSDDREAVGAQGVPLTPGHSIAVDNSLHVYGTPFFIQAGLPLTGEKRSIGFHRLMIAQDTGSAIVGPARADIYWGAGDQAGHLAGHVHHPGNFAMLVPRELDPVEAGARMPLPPKKPPAAAEPSKNAITEIAVRPAASHQLRWSLRECRTCNGAEVGLDGRAKPMNASRPLLQQPKPLNSKTAEIGTSAPAPRLPSVVARPARHMTRDSRRRALANNRLGWGF
jgi:membrane-bound lytic murein transglycosylase A